MARLIWEGAENTDDKVFRAFVTVTAKPGKDVWTGEHNGWTRTYRWGPYGSHRAAAGMATFKANHYIRRGHEVVKGVEEADTSWKVVEK